MKQLLIIAFLVISNYSLGQEIDIKELICSGKWHLEYLEMDGDKDYLSESEQKTNWVLFSTNGNLEVLEEGENYSGTWEYLAEKGVLRTNDRDGKVDQKIIKITKSVFIVSVIDFGEEIIMGMRKL